MKGDKKGRQGDEENEGNANGKGEERKIHDTRGAIIRRQKTLRHRQRRGGIICFIHIEKTLRM